MKKRFAAMAFLIFFLFTLSGCGQGVFNRKFVRKNAKETAPPQIYTIKPYTKPPNAEIYSHAFLFWKTWEDELLIALSPAGYPRVINNLKVKECIKEAINNLNEMKKCLNEAKAKELDSYMKELQRYDTLLVNDDMSDTAFVRMKSDIETNKRNIDIRFSPKAVKSNLAPDEPLAQ